MRISREQLKEAFCTEKKISDFVIYVLCALVVILLTPIVARNFPNIFIIALMLLFCICVAPRVRALRKGDIQVLAVLAAYLIVITVYKLTGKSSAELYYYFNTVQFFFFLGAVLTIYQDLNKKQTNLLLKVSVGAMAFTMMYNVILYFVHGPKAYVELFQENKYVTNAINTPYVTAIMLVSGAALVYGLHKRNWFAKSIAFFISLCGFLFIVVISQRMIAVLLSIVMYMLIFCSYIKENPLKRLPAEKRKIAIAAIIAALVLLFLLRVPILQLIRSMVSSDRLVKRINQLIRFMKTGDINEAGGSLAARFRLMSTSFHTFVSSFGNFMIGAGDHRATNEIIGNHSLFLDELARYGILFAPLSFYLVYCATQVVRKVSAVKPGTVLSKQVDAIIITLVLRCMVGAIFDASVGISLFLIVPLVLKSLNTRKVKKRKN